MKLTHTTVLFACLWVAISACLAQTEAPSSEPSEPVTIWPFFTRDHNVFGEKRVRAFGPFFQHLEATNGSSMLGIHPLYSQVHLPEDNNSREHHALWPLWFGRGAGKQYKWQVLALLFWHDFDITQPRSRHHLWLLPIYFQGRNADGIPYVALFPIGGKIRNFLGCDELGFVLFPLYGYSEHQKQETVTVLWPVYSKTTGPHNQRWRIFPFYGHARCRNVYEKLFLFWPIWSQASYSYRNSSGYSCFFFPLCGHLNVTSQEAWWIAPPFIRFSTRGANQLHYLPWPFIQIASGDIEKLYFWPIWGHKRAYGSPYTFFLWPIVRYWEQMDGGIRGDQLMIMPIWYSKTNIKPADNKGTIKPVVVERQSKCWPFYNYTREKDKSRLGIPALCPFRSIEAIERNYAPLWTLYTRQQNGALVEDDVLWGLFRHRRGPGERQVELFPVFRVARNDHNNTRSWSLMKGLVARRQHGDEVVYRMLYVLTWRSRAESKAKAMPEQP